MKLIIRKLTAKIQKVSEAFLLDFIYLHEMGMSPVEFSQLLPEIDAKGQESRHAASLYRAKLSDAAKLPPEFDHAMRTPSPNH